MKRAGAADSQSSECSSMLDLSCTYNISASPLQPEPTAGTWEEDSSFASSSSLSNTGYRTSHYEESKKRRREDAEVSSALSPSSSFPIVGEQRSCTITSSPKLETNEEHEDAQIQANLDAFYDLSSLPGDDAFSHHLTEKISELKQKKHLYALHSFQMAKILLQHEGTKVLQGCITDNVFSSTGETTNIQPVPGLSDDVVRFLQNRTSTKKGP